MDEIEVQGLDVMSAGVALAWATEAQQRGLITDERDGRAAAGVWQRQDLHRSGQAHRQPADRRSTAPWRAARRTQPRSTAGLNLP